MLADRFERADGEPGTAPTGHHWYNGGQHRGVIADGRLVKEETGPATAFYLETLMPDRLRRVDFEFSFVGTSGDNCAVVVLGSRDGLKSALGIYRNMVHVVFSAAGVNVDYYTDGVYNNVASFSYAEPLALDGTVYRGAMRFEGQSVIVTEPDGTEHTVTDPALDQAGRYMAIEGFVAAEQDAEPRWESILAVA